MKKRDRKNENKKNKRKWNKKLMTKINLWIGQNLCKAFLKGG